MENVRLKTFIPFPILRIGERDTARYLPSYSCGEAGPACSDGWPGFPGWGTALASLQPGVAHGNPE